MAEELTDIIGPPEESRKTAVVRKRGESRAGMRLRRLGYSDEQIAPFVRTNYLGESDGMEFGRIAAAVQNANEEQARLEKDEFDMRMKVRDLELREMKMDQEKAQRQAELEIQTRKRQAAGTLLTALPRLQPGTGSFMRQYGELIAKNVYGRNDEAVQELSTSLLEAHRELTGDDRDIEMIGREAVAKAQAVLRQRDIFEKGVRDEEGNLVTRGVGDEFQMESISDRGVEFKRKEPEEPDKAPSFSSRNSAISFVNSQIGDNATYAQVRDAVMAGERNAGGIEFDGKRNGGVRITDALREAVKFAEGVPGKDVPPRTGVDPARVKELEEMLLAE